MNTITYPTLKEIKQTPNDPANVILDKDDCSEWYKQNSYDEDQLDDLTSLEGDEGKYYIVLSTLLKTSPPDKLLTRLPLLLAQIITEIN